MRYTEDELKKYWNELDKFIYHHDVPKLPKPLTEFYINKIIELGGIKKLNLEDGVFYYGNFRCTDVGKWNEKENTFEYKNYEFGQFSLNKCNHFEDDDSFALFVPIRKATKEEIDISFPKN